MRLYIRRGSLIAESQERVARAKSLTGDMGVSPTIKFPLLLARGSSHNSKGQVSEIPTFGRFSSIMNLVN